MKSLILLLSLNFFSSFIFGQVNCTSVSATGGNGQITVSGLNGAPIAGIQVFNSSWASVFNQTYTSPANSITVSPIAAGQYFVNVRLYNSNWTTICEKGINVTVNENAPPVDTCGPTFQRTYGTLPGEEYAVDLAKSSDGGYIAAGKAAVNGTTNFDGLLMKFNSNGSLLWSKTYGGSQYDELFVLTTTTDGGIVAGGMTKSAGNSQGDAWVVKTDASGNLVWQKRYTDNTSPGFIYSLVQTSDGGYGIAGTFPNSPGVAEWMVLKTDATGNIQWQKTLGSSSSDDAWGVVEDNHGGAGLVVSGYNYQGTFNANLAKFDIATGNLLWSKNWDFDGRMNRLGRILKVSDGFVVTGATHDGFASDNSTQVILKTDFNGNIVSIKEFDIPGCQDGHTTILPDGGYMITQSEISNDPSSDIHLMRIDANNNIMWTKKYPRADLQWLNKLVTDGNYVVGVGFLRSSAFNDVMLVKSDFSGKMGTCSSVPENGTSRTPAVTNLGSPWVTNTNLNLSVNNTAASVLSSNYSSTILCIDACATPVPTISNVTVSENAGNAVLQVCVSSPATDTLRYVYSTANGTATSGTDFTGGSGMVQINPGETCGVISIPITNDGMAEATENFTVSIGSVSGTVTINDDDQPQINCNNVTITPGNNSIVVGGVSAPVATIQVFNSSWATVFNQTYTNSPGTVNVPIGPGTYLVKVTFYTSNWTYVCDKSENATVINQCPAGTICISNFCPAQTVNLNDAYSIPNLPAGTVVSWHTGTPATDANKMTAAQAQNVSVSGTYYAAINISGANCYSATIPVNVTIVACTSSAVTNAVQLKNESSPSTRNIMVFPNPFTRSVRVVIDSEKKERGSLILTDVLGRQLKSLPVQLVPGSNTFLMEGLDQFPSGNYFLTIRSANEMKTIKLMRQQ